MNKEEKKLLTAMSLALDIAVTVIAKDLNACPFAIREKFLNEAWEIVRKQKPQMIIKNLETGEILYQDDSDQLLEEIGNLKLKQVRVSNYLLAIEPAVTDKSKKALLREAVKILRGDK